MKLSIIIIGDEILLGQVTDTNSGDIARMLGPKGWTVVETRVVADDAEAISKAVDAAMKQSDLVITTGGLGPTKDDITKKVLTKYFGGEMTRNPEVTENIKRVFGLRGIPLNEYTLEQALVPTSCRVIQNQYGTAPIMWFEKDGKVLISMPGVPFETVGMLKHSVVDEIMKHFSPDLALHHHTFVVSGIAESALAMALDTWEKTLPSTLHLAYLPNPGYIRLRLDGTGATGEEFDNAVAQLKANVHTWLVHDGDATPAEILLEKLRAKGYSLATAESCTGGNIAHRITGVPGSSENFLGSVVSYANSVKEHMLGVSAYDLETAGAVSEPVVLAMAEGVCRVTGADCSVATSGIAGPGGGTPEKPVGTVWIAARTPQLTVAECRQFPGDRARVIDRATTEAIIMLARLLD